MAPPHGRTARRAPLLLCRLLHRRRCGFELVLAATRSKACSLRSGDREARRAATTPRHGRRARCGAGPCRQRLSQIRDDPVCAIAPRAKPTAAGFMQRGAGWPPHAVASSTQLTLQSLGRHAQRCHVADAPQWARTPQGHHNKASAQASRRIAVLLQALVDQARSCPMSHGGMTARPTPGGARAPAPTTSRTWPAKV